MTTETEGLGVKSVRLENLKALQKSVGSQKKLAELLDIQSSEISQIKNPKHPRNVGDNLARRIESTFGWKPGAMDSLMIIEDEAHLAKPLDEMSNEEIKVLRNALVHSREPKSVSFIAMTGVVSKALEIEQAKSIENELGGFEAWDSNTPLGQDEVEVPFFMDVELAAGAGGEISNEVKGPKLRFAISTLRRCGVDPESAACVKVTGNSMEPRLFDGDVVGVDTSNTRIVDGKTYAINHDGLLRIKRLYLLPGGGIRINSFNSTEHPDEKYTGPERETIKVIGKVFWHSSIW